MGKPEGNLEARTPLSLSPEYSRVRQEDREEGSKICSPVTAGAASGSGSGSSSSTIPAAAAVG